MTKEEFDKTRWSAGMHAVISGDLVAIIEVDFEYRGIRLDDEIEWICCKDITLATSEQIAKHNSETEDKRSTL